MPPVSPPFLPHLMEAQRENVYTLILDLDETLVHYYELGAEGKFLVRPGTEEFLNEMAKYYEIVIFTAATQDVIYIYIYITIYISECSMLTGWWIE